jgi:hypothetical protein
MFLLNKYIATKICHGLFLFVILGFFVQEKTYVTSMIEKRRKERRETKKVNGKKRGNENTTQ